LKSLHLGFPIYFSSPNDSEDAQKTILAKQHNDIWLDERTTLHEEGKEEAICIAII
jgi:hypothetical protein